MPKDAPLREPTDIELEALRGFHKLHQRLGRPPSLSELAVELGYTGKAGAKTVVDRLVKIGLMLPSRTVPAEITPRGKKRL
jgi:hypothetical protein